MPPGVTSSRARPERPAGRGSGRSKRLAEAGLGLARFSVFAASLVLLLLARATSPYVLAGAVVGIGLALVLCGSRARPWLAYVVLFVAFVELRALADETGVPVRSEYVVSLDALVPYVGVPTLWLQQAFYTPGALGLLDFWVVAVYSSYFVVPHLLALILWRSRREEFRRYAVAVMAVLYAGLAVCFLVPTAPPWLAGQTGHLPPVSRVVQDAWHPDLYGQGYEIAGINPVAAMPSLHTAVTVLVAIALWRYGPLLRVGGVIYAVSMAFALVYAGEHYVADVLAGVAVAAAAGWLTGSARAASLLRHARARTGKPAPRVGEAVPGSSAAGA